MSATSDIAWTDATANFWIGCTKVSPGCQNCYAEAENRRRKWAAGGNWGKGAPRKFTKAAEKTCRRLNAAAGRGEFFEIDLRKGSTFRGTLRDAIRQMGLAGVPTPGIGDIARMVAARPRIFCHSLSDWLDDEVPAEWLADMLAVIDACRNVDFLLLTKRPGNFAARMRAAADNARLLSTRQFARHWAEGVAAPPHVAIGVSVESPETKHRIKDAFDEIPAGRYFASCEPLLAPLEYLWYYLTPKMLGPGAMNGNASFHSHDTKSLSWVIVGGESDQPGGKARPFDLAWAREIRDQCARFGTPFFFKQAGDTPISANAGEAERITGKGGRDFASFPEDLRIRQFYEPFPALK